MKKKQIESRKTADFTIRRRKNKGKKQNERKKVKKNQIMLQSKIENFFLVDCIFELNTKYIQTDTHTHTHTSTHTSTHRHRQKYTKKKITHEKKEY